MGKIDKNYLIDAYLSNELEGEVLEQFQISMTLDKELEKEMKFQKEFMESLADENKSELRQSLNKYHKVHAVGLTNILHRIRTEAIAAVITALLIVGAGLTGLFNFTDSYDSVYDSNFNPEMYKVVVRSADQNVESNLDLGIDLYNKGEYKLAIESFDLEESNFEAILYSGICYMELEKFDTAIERFSNVLDDNNNLYLDQSEWYLSLCYLKSDNIELATDILTNISNNSGVYSSRAIDMLNNLKE